jgi:hypothetical protein
VDNEDSEKRGRRTRRKIKNEIKSARRRPHERRGG